MNLGSSDSGPGFFVSEPAGSIFYSRIANIMKEVAGV